MPLPAFLAVNDAVPELDGQCLACLGRPEVLPERHRGTTLVFDTVTEETLAHIAALDPKLMAEGLVIVTSTPEHQARPRAVLRAQKLLAYLFVKNVLMPAGSTRVPDPLHLRPDNAPPEYLHQLNIYRNTPLHLRHCLVDKLEKQRVGLPCLLLLPGPSLSQLAPALQELNRRFLTVAISRSLPFLRQNGLKPDILLQIDTVPMQQHFHDPDERFPDSVLLTLSLAPVHGIAPRFRRVFFIDSFNLAALPNTARIRESWLSSLLAVLGCAEALHAPRVLLAGADLRLMGNATYFNEGEGEGDLGPGLDQPAAPMRCHDGDTVVLPDAMGRPAHTRLQYFASAGEAELFATQIQADKGTTFGNLSPVSILDQAIFPPVALEEALAAPAIDKRVLMAKADAADTASETISLRSLRATYSREMQNARKDRDLMTCLHLGGAEALERHVCFRYVRDNLPWFRPKDVSKQGLVAANLAGELYRAARFARNVTTLHLLGAKGSAVPVLATAEEEAWARRGLSQWRPDWKWRFCGIRTLGYEAPMPTGGGVELASLCDWLSFQDAVVISPGLAREFDYVLSLVSGENVIPLEELLAYRPVAGEDGQEGQAGDEPAAP